MKKFKIKKGDPVIVTAGKDKGRSGTILKIITKENKVIISNINVFKKHTKQTQNTEGGIVLKELPIHISNILYNDLKQGPTKIGYKILSDGSKVRFMKKTGEIIYEEVNVN